MFPWDSRCIFHPMTTRTEILRANYKLYNENEMEKNDIRGATSHVRRNFIQVICFFRDMCIDAMQTFANVFRGIVNVISNISRDDVEDFASACIVVILCTGAVKMFTDILKKNPHVKLFNVFGQRVTQTDNNNNLTASSHGQDACPPERKSGRRTKRRNNKRYRRISEMNN
ncbi:uncharacterized protein [Linepithema humile]|uniref:uncharacterized protein n=1 Tax=Linepithema humile TaxID=83485 RepID=UPI00351F5DD7